MARHPLALPRPTPEQLARFDVAAPRYTSYPTVPEWTEAIRGEEYGAALADLGAAMEPVSVYVHLPFCRELCLYCGCNVVVSRSPRVADGYLDDLEREAALLADRIGTRLPVSRLHWGGGTPTFLEPRQLVRLWEILARTFAVEQAWEVALEIDPVVTTAEQLRVLRGLGFNRVSMGVQDFDPRVQEAVRRRQGFAQTRAHVETARALGFHSVNLDLIYGLPHQTPQSWERTLERVLELAPDRLALFSFAYVPQARPHQAKLEAAALPGAEAKIDLFRAAYATLVAAGMLPIGMDHFARRGDELAVALEERRLTRDFQGYTTRAGQTVALGITGIGDLGLLYAQSVRSRSVYRGRLLAGELPIERGIWISDEDRRRREVIHTLLCNHWVDLGPGAEGEFAAELAQARALAGEGLVEVSGSELHVTPLGRLFVRNLAMLFDARLRRGAGAGEAPVFSRAV